MDIIHIEPNKQIVRLSLWYLRKQLGAKGNAKQIQAEMETCSNDGIRNIAKLIKDNAMEIKSLSQRKVVIELSMLILWIILHDTAYRNIAFAILDDILYNSKALRSMIKPFVLPPEEWYPNGWIDSKELTVKQRDEGRIPDYAYSKVEAQCVPSMHRAELKKILNKMDNEK
jgi:hypothetical protein